jgi:hypothetical protein
VVESEPYSMTPEPGGTRDGPGRGCIALLVVILIFLLLCCCAIVGLTGLYYVSPEVHDMISGLLSSFLTG